MSLIKSILLRSLLFMVFFMAESVWCAPADSNGAAKALMSFSLDILKDNAREKTNTFISPLSIMFALSLAANGAGGETLSEFHTILGGDTPAINNYYTSLNVTLADSRGVTVQIANGIFADKKAKIVPAFMAAVKPYNAEVITLDFSTGKSIDFINKWVDRKTDGLISSIIDRLSPLDRLVLVNTIYFKGEWLMPFDANLTVKNNFFPAQGEPVLANFMCLKSRLQTYSDTALDAIFLPYKGERYEMLLLLPKDDTSLLPLISIGYIDKIVTERKWEQVSLSMLKFDAEGIYSLNKTLKKLGLKNAFEEQADFSAMSSVRPLFISQVVHKAKVSVTETGTEAAAATAITIRTTSAAISERVIEFNRPFLYCIYDTRTKQMLFTGIMEYPGK